MKRAKTICFGLFVMMFSGCTRCEECTLHGATETLCETEFDSPDQYQDAIAEREILGATCTSAGGL